jgi:recombination protein RecA
LSRTKSHRRFVIAEFDMYNDHAASATKRTSWISAVENKIIDRSGSWFSYGSTKLGQGRDRARVYLEENPADCSLRFGHEILDLKNVSSGVEEAAEEAVVATEE